jgi:hypothetical protein
VSNINPVTLLVFLVWRRSLGLCYQAPNQRAGAERRSARSVLHPKVSSPNPEHPSAERLHLRGFPVYFRNWLVHAWGVNWYNVAKADPLITFTRVQHVCICREKQNCAALAQLLRILFRFRMSFSDHCSLSSKFSVLKSPGPSAEIQ